MRKTRRKIQRKVKRKKGKKKKCFLDRELTAREQRFSYYMLILETLIVGAILLTEFYMCYMEYWR